MCCTCTPRKKSSADLPLVLQSLDVESQRWRDGVDVFTVELFEHCRLAGVVQSTARMCTVSL